MAELDLVNRDPNNLNGHLKVTFEEVLGEPEGVHSIDCVWKLSYTCFNLWLNLCYKISTLCCGICIAMEWGCEFAYTAFYHIWCISPMLKLCEINCGICKRCFTTCMNCLMEPVCTACGALFIHFKK